MVRALGNLRLAITAGVALGGMAGCLPAHAQSGGEADRPPGSGGLDEIVVTAEKRETNLQKTPIAISVLGSEDLANRRVQSLADLSDGAVPSLRVAPFASRSSALTVGIRGIVSVDANQPSRDQGIGIYIDGVYLGRSQGLGVALLDVERIEVLKGPQGTLFGRNAVGGAVSIVSRKPTGELGLRAVAGMGNFGGYKAEGHLDLPAIGGLKLKLDGIFTRRGGTVENAYAGADDFNRYSRYGLHTAALIEPTDTLSIQIDADYSHDVTTPFYAQLLEKNPSAPALAPLVKVQGDRARTVDIGVPLQGSVGKTWGAALHLNWEIAPSTELRSISSYRRLSQGQFDSAFGAHVGPFVPNAFCCSYSLASIRQRQASQEFQLVGSGERLNYVAGLFYYHESADDDAWGVGILRWNADGTAVIPLPSLAAGARNVFPDRASNAKADSYAAYGQATYRPAILDDMFALTLGGRFTRDKKSGVLFKVNGADTDIGFRFSSSRFDPMITITADPSEGLHLYGKWGTAYRAGGANSRSLIYRAYGPEEVSTFEAGAKTELLDRRARLNIAAYTTRYSNVQTNFAAPPVAGGRSTAETLNAPGHGTIKGIEVDASLAPLQGVTISASYAYTDAQLPPAANPFRNGTFEQTYIIGTPRHAGSVAIDFDQPIGPGVLRAHLDANLASGYYANPSENTRTDKSFIVNGRLSLSEIQMPGNFRSEVSLWSRNLLNEQHVFFNSRSTYAVIGEYGIFNEPRTFGLDLTVKY